ncbi:MAG TPA: hypothetical protein VJ299_03865, partial [Steroidobacteraceae bacterium]|nr:hypothetical protein [Steroidobacteraceae bacterium]
EVFLDAVDGHVLAGAFGELAWAKYVGMLLGLTIMWVVSKRFRRRRSPRRSANRWIISSCRSMR